MAEKRQHDTGHCFFKVTYKILFSSLSEPQNTPIFAQLISTYFIALIALRASK